MLSALVALSLIICAQPSLGGLYSSFSDLPSNTEYDYIIVGGKAILSSCFICG